MPISGQGAAQCRSCGSNSVLAVRVFVDGWKFWCARCHRELDLDPDGVTVIRGKDERVVVDPSPMERHFLAEALVMKGEDLVRLRQELLEPEPD